MKKLLVIFFAVCFVFLISCSMISKVTEVQWAKIKTREIPFPKDKAYDAVLSLFSERGLDITGANRDSGTISTDWTSMGFGAQVFTKALLGVSGDTSSKYSVFVRAKTPDSSEVTVNIVLRVKDATMSQSSTLPPRTYDDFFTKLGEKLGIEMPPVAPTLKEE